MYIKNNNNNNIIYIYKASEKQKRIMLYFWASIWKIHPTIILFYILARVFLSYIAQFTLMRYKIICLYYLRVATDCLYTSICGIRWTNCFSSPTVLAACRSSYCATTDFAWRESLGPTAEKLQSLISANRASDDDRWIVLVSWKAESSDVLESVVAGANFSPGSFTVPEMEDSYDWVSYFRKKI